MWGIKQTNLTVEHISEMDSCLSDVAKVQSELHTMDTKHTFTHPWGAATQG